LGTDLHQNMISCVDKEYRFLVKVAMKPKDEREKLSLIAEAYEEVEDTKIFEKVINVEKIKKCEDVEDIKKCKKVAYDENIKTPRRKKAKEIAKIYEETQEIDTVQANDGDQKIKMSKDKKAPVKEPIFIEDDEPLKNYKKRKVQVKKEDSNIKGQIKKKIKIEKD